MDGNRAQGGTSSQNILSNYKFGKTLGIGAFGKVKLAIHTLTGLKVAIKILDRQSIHGSEEKQEKVRREINILRLLCSPHIVQLYEVIETRLAIYVVMEYMNSGELFDYITEHGRLEEDEARYFFQQIISGVESCHLHKVVHRDLKPENLLLDSKGNVKIADFGLGNVMRDGHFLKTSCGSPNYAAPEVISEQLYAGPEVDVWSCGVILYALLCGRLPFDDDNLPGLRAKIMNGVYTFPNYMSHGARDLIARILVVDPVYRLTIPEIHQHLWFQQHLPQYFAIPAKNLLYNPMKIDEEVVAEMSILGFDVHEVIKSVHNLLGNQATVTYFMLLHKRIGVNASYYKKELLEFPDFMERPNVYLRPIPLIQRNWALGFKSLAPPNEALRDVLEVFESLNVRWKKTGHYNMKCLWLPPVLSCSTATVGGRCTRIKDKHGHEDVSTTILSKKSFSANDTIKFEIQLYKASEESYVLDWQIIYGPPFLFLELCSAFRAQVVT